MIVGCLFFGLMLLVEMSNGRFWLNDFKVMYSAAEAYLNGEQIYGKPFGLMTGFYKYSPFTMLLFVPISLLPFEVASVIHFACIGFVTLITIVFLDRLVRNYFKSFRKKNYWNYLAILLFILIHMVRELHLGNINMILMFLLSLSLFFTLQKRAILSGLFLAIVILAKPYFLIIGLALLVNNKYKAVYSTASWVLGFIALSFLIIGLNDGLNLYSDWIKAMLAHDNYLSSPNTLLSILNQYTGIQIDTSYAFFLLGLVVLLISGFYFQLRNSIQEDNVASKERTFIIHYFILIACVPSILTTDTEHFLFALPLLIILFLHFLRNDFLPVTCFVILIVMYGSNSTDLLGDNLSNAYHQWGILGISNFLILTASMTLFYREVTKKS